VADLGKALVQQVTTLHKLALAVTSELTEEQLSWFPGPDAPCPGWHFWHLARWADILQAGRPGREGRGEQIWLAENLAAKWGHSPESLGPLAAGQGMETDVCLAGKEALLDYGRRAMAAADEAVAHLEASHLGLPSQLRAAGPSTVGEDLVFYVGHSSRHLGMLEALRGALGLKGTATI